MTLISKCILAGYVVLHLLVTILADRCFLAHARDPFAYRRKRAVWILLFLLATAIPVAATFLSGRPVSFWLQRIGNIFLAFDLHLAGLFLLFSLLFWIIHLFTGERSALPIPILLLILAGGIAVPAYGLYHAQQPVVKYFDADLRKTDEDGSHLRVALIADLHLSVNSHVKTIEKMVTLLNAQQPDVVMVAGDIFTSSYDALRNPEQYAAALRRIEAPMGVYAVYGNHDVEETLFSGFAVRPVSEAFRTPQIEQFFKDSGFTVLYDEVTTIADGRIQLAGRIDGSKAGDGTAERLSAAELLQDADPEVPLFVLEHEPADYKELSNAGADLVMSGHTHNGQIFPGNIYVTIANENGYGQKTLYGMETFVTSGVGTFGPPMRTGTNSEIMIIDIHTSSAAETQE